MRLSFRRRPRRRDHDRAAMLRQALGRRSIVLVGLMGAGKTTVGRRLAVRMELPFVDADAEIERAAGMTIADIFAEHGEAHFRDGERRVIARLLREGGPQVLATGGGAYMDPETRETIAREALSVWLRAEFDVLMERVARRGNRPLLQTDDPEAVMRRLIEERYPVYGQADVTVMSRNVPHDLVVSDVVDALCEHLDLLQHRKS